MMINKIGLHFGEHYDSVTLDGKPLSPERSQGVWNHSPDGFAWGYGGSGPAQLALAILLEVTDDDGLSVELHQDFKSVFLAPLPQGDAELDLDVAEWVRLQTAQSEVAS